MNELSVYREMIRAYLGGSVPSFVLNPDEAHASIVIEEMVRSSRTSFYAYAKRMDRKVWTLRVLEELKKAVDRDVDVRLLVENECEALESPVVSSCEALKNSVRKNDGVTSQIVRVNHFAVADRKVIRWETDPISRSAGFSANNRSGAAEAEDLFNRLYSEGRRCA